MDDTRSILYRHYERLGVALIHCMQQLKNNDADGFCAYQNTAEEIETLMRVCAFDEGEAVEDILCQMQVAAYHENIAALSEILETKAYPMVKAWLERVQDSNDLI